MKILSMLALSAAVILASGCAHGKDTEMATRLIQEAKQKLAPDKRTAVFDVKGELEAGTLTLRGEIQSAEMKQKLLEYLKEKTKYTIIDSLRSLPHPGLGGKIYGVVSVSVANLRTSPDHGAEMATQAIMGTPVKVLKKEHGGWYYIQTPDQYLGWSDDMIRFMTQDEFDAWLKLPKVIVTAEYGFTRQAPDKGSQPVSDIVVGAVFVLKGESRTHFEVQYPDGRTGFLAREEAEPYDQWLDRAEDAPEKVVATARRFFGVPYLWGGTSSKGLDCSGFTKTVYFLNGVLLPRDASQQALVGTPVEVVQGYSTFKPGDLLFFGTKATGSTPEHVTHVGMSLGGARFIHESGDVRINSLSPADSDYSAQRQESFLRARRVIGAGEQTGIKRLSKIAYLTVKKP